MTLDQKIEEYCLKAKKENEAIRKKLEKWKICLKLFFKKLHNNKSEIETFRMQYSLNL